VSVLQDESLSLVTARPAPAFRRYGQEIAALTSRNLIRIQRSPERIMFSLITPIMFTLLFRFVFGGAISSLQGVSYPLYLIPGVAVQIIALASVTSGFAIADDLTTGYFYRVRTLPTARSAVLLARVCADLVNSVGQLVVLLAVGFAVGYRTSSAAGLVAGCGVLLLFGVALSLAFATIGLWVSRPDTVNAIAMPLIFPLTFASTAFVPPATMPGWLQQFAQYQPVSVACDAFRALALGQQDTPAVRHAFFGGRSDAELVLAAVAWSVAIAAVALAMALRRYRRLSG
jgi:ABC-2 type transport system permease protein/oleandomycin transport system permease protein